MLDVPVSSQTRSHSLGGSLKAAVGATPDFDYSDPDDLLAPLKSNSGINKHLKADHESKCLVTLALAKSKPVLPSSADALLGRWSYTCMRAQGYRSSCVGGDIYRLKSDGACSKTDHDQCWSKALVSFSHHPLMSVICLLFQPQGFPCFLSIATVNLLSNLVSAWNLLTRWEKELNELCFSVPGWMPGEPNRTWTLSGKTKLQLMYWVIVVLDKYPPRNLPETLFSRVKFAD